MFKIKKSYVVSMGNDEVTLAENEIGNLFPDTSLEEELDNE